MWEESEKTFRGRKRGLGPQKTYGWMPEAIKARL